MRRRWRCAACGDGEDFSYIVWEDRPLCAGCFARELGRYAERYPFLLAEELGLAVRQVPEEA